MGIQQTESVRRAHALHLVDADLDHLERAIRQPENRMLNTQYWERRARSVWHHYELTDEQRARVEAILERLAQRSRQTVTFPSPR
jgi:Spy/CpxP family protein refolding chaperone